MPFEIVRNDIVNMRVDAIVNTANPRPEIGSGTDTAIHQAAGPQLLEARKQIGHIAVGDAVMTPGFHLHAHFVIHTVGPVWRGGLFGEAKKLRRCYDTALELAQKRGCRSIAFPLISTGNYGFPKEKALQIAIAAFSEFLARHEMQIYLVVFNREAFRLSEQLVSQVASYIDEHYVETKIRKEYPRQSSNRLEAWRIREEALYDCKPICMPAALSSALSLEELLKQTDAGFTENLLERIDKTGKKDAEIYKRANVSKQHFSKIRNNPGYKPTKATAVAFAIALELDLQETKDLIGRAGYALTNSSKFDIIIRYFIEQGNYNMYDINAALFEFDQPLLGA